MLPTFLVIGAMKCGTTSLYYYLDEHPQIGMSSIKETNFFIEENENWHRGEDWYESQFPEEKGIERGECSPNYTKRHLFGGVPERIHNICPQARLIYLVRDPIERTISHYVGSCIRGREDRSFEKVLDLSEESNYVQTSMYHTQLQSYYSIFPPDRIKVIKTEDMNGGATRVLKSIYRFLGVSDEFENQHVNTRYNVSKEKKKQGRWYRWISQHLSQPLKDRLRPYLSLQWRPGRTVEKPSLSSAGRKKLEQIFRPEVEALREYTGDSFSEWSV